MPREVNRQPILRHPRRVIRYELRPTLVNVPTLANPSGAQRFPCVEALLGTRTSVHDTVVSVIDQNGDELNFMVSCQVNQDQRLSVNRSLRSICEVEWCGSVLVMKIGRRSAFVNMTTSDKDLANVAIVRFIEETNGPVGLEYVDFLEL
ncbi:hypothetical protein DFP72DRAFT_850909 [Ephemerocybe angulata]|uniref:Uncharacterized protein n=1 Tax=Ephemerocybe angulata TaxID=980116 RepID=A0A8H6HRZ1_9AGAR|nr:hypothetical protein DFP72DRAFT_850909 [Tulosesus angulatus]